MTLDSWNVRGIRVVERRGEDMVWNVGLKVDMEANTNTAFHAK